MENPLELPVPSNPIQRIHDFARDIAYGSIQGYWPSEISVDQNGNWIIIETFRKKVGLFPDEETFLKKWYPKNLAYAVAPSFSLLLSFGYLEKIGERGEKVIQLNRHTGDFSSKKITPPRFELDYILTSQAFARLDRPATAPSVFISYKQDQSSALALLVESRLKVVDSNISIFIDKNIQPSEDLNVQIATALDNCQHFVCLLGPITLQDSKAVRDEIEIAMKNGLKIVPICHNGYTVDDLYRNLLNNTKAIVIKPPESAEEYEIAMTRLLISLGYPTVK